MEDEGRTFFEGVRNTREEAEKFKEELKKGPYKLWYVIAEYNL